MTIVNFSITNPDGSPVSNALIDIQLPQAGVNALDENLIIPTAIKETTNSQGKLSVELAPITTVAYKAVIYDENKNRKGIYEFFVPESENPVDISDLVLLPKPSGVNYDAAAIADITNERILAQQAAEAATLLNNPRYKISNLPFENIGGNFFGFLNFDQANGFIIVDEDKGTVIIPDNEEVPYPIGTALVFIKGKIYPEIDISFQGENANVIVDSLSITGTKLQFATDQVNLVKVAENEWKIFNLSEGGATGSTEQDFIEIYQRFDNVDDQISALEGWRTAFNTRLNVLELTTSQNTAAIAAINSTLSSITSVIAKINSTIDQKITEAVPGLGDISASVDAAAASASAAADSADSAADSSNSAFSSATDAEISRINALNSETVINSIIGGAGFVVPNLTALKALDINEPIESAFLEGVNAPNDPIGSPKRYFYSAASVAVDDGVYVVVPTSIETSPAYIANPLTAPGRWLHLPVANDQFNDNTFNGGKVLTGSLPISKLEDVSQRSFLGRQSGVGTGAVQVMSQAEARNNLGLGSNAYDNGYENVSVSDLTNPTPGTQYLQYIIGNADAWGYSGTGDNFIQSDAFERPSLNRIPSGVANPGHTVGFRCLCKGRIRINFSHYIRGFSGTAYAQMWQLRRQVLTNILGSTISGSQVQASQGDFDIEPGDAIFIVHWQLPLSGNSRIQDFWVGSNNVAALIS